MRGVGVVIGLIRSGGSWVGSPGYPLSFFFFLPLSHSLTPSISSPYCPQVSPLSMGCGGCEWWWMWKRRWSQHKYSITRSPHRVTEFLTPSHFICLVAHSTGTLK